MRPKAKSYHNQHIQTDPSGNLEGAVEDTVTLGGEAGSPV